MLKRTLSLPDLKFQKVLLGGVSFLAAISISGVTQGTVLDPLLFSIATSVFLNVLYKYIGGLRLFNRNSYHTWHYTLRTNSRQSGSVIIPYKVIKRIYSLICGIVTGRPSAYYSCARCIWDISCHIRNIITVFEIMIIFTSVAGFQVYRDSSSHCWCGGG